jgi:hypothetical protein
MDHPDETYPKLGGKSVGQLWSSVQSSLGDDYEGFLGEVKYSIPEGDIGNIEDLLSQARLATQFSEESEKIQTGINSAI